MASQMLAGGAALPRASRRRGLRARCAAGGNAQRAASAPAQPPPPPAVRRPAAPPASLWDSLGSSVAEKQGSGSRPGGGASKTAPARSRRRVRDGAPDPEVDEEEALGWKVIETGEGSDAGDGEDGFGRADGLRSLPAEMRYFDRAKIYVKAGDGGMGSTAFRREAQVSMGGPSGGNGGDGGAVWIVGDAARNSLLSFRKTVHFRASNGQNGEGKNCYGACAQPLPADTRARRRGIARRRLSPSPPQTQGATATTSLSRCLWARW